MRWADVDLESAWWTIPGEHAKERIAASGPVHPPGGDNPDLYTSEIGNPGFKRPGDAPALLSPPTGRGDPVALMRSALRVEGQPAPEPGHPSRWRQ